MTRPSTQHIAQEIQATRRSILDRFCKMSAAEQLAQLASYAKAKASGQAVFHPFHTCFA